MCSKDKEGPTSVVIRSKESGDETGGAVTTDRHGSFNPGQSQAPPGIITSEAKI